MIRILTAALMSLHHMLLASALPSQRLHNDRITFHAVRHLPSEVTISKIASSNCYDLGPKSPKAGSICLSVVHVLQNYAMSANGIIDFKPALEGIIFNNFSVRDLYTFSGQEGYSSVYGSIVILKIIHNLFSQVHSCKTNVNVDIDIPRNTSSNVLKVRRVFNRSVYITREYAIYRYANFNPRPHVFTHEVVLPLHSLGGFVGIFNGLASKDDLPEEEGRTYSGDPKTVLCPKCAIFSSVS